MALLRDFIRGLEKMVFTEPPVCVQCYRRTTEGGYVSKAHGYELIFCSMGCGHAYWNEYGQFKRDPTSITYQQGPRICRLPGCNKPCYQEGSKVHDYCGRTHAREHGAMGGGASPKGGKGGRSTGYYRQNSGGHASPNHNSSSFTSGYHSGWSQSGSILFYNRGDPYYEFTNFYEAVVTIDGEDWLTTEHYFQAQKFVGTPLVGTIRMLERPREAFDKSRDPRYSSWRRSDWEDVKEDVMYKALQAKFSQHEKLGQQLRETGERKLIEHSPYDSYWGDGGDGSGKNRLGILLMKLRKEMKPKPPPVTAPSPPSPIHSRPPPPSPPTITERLQKDSTTTSSHSVSEEPAGQPSPYTGSRSENNAPARENPPPANTNYGGTLPIVQPSDVVVSTHPSRPTAQQYNVTMTFPSTVVTSPPLVTQSGSQHAPMTTSVYSFQHHTITCSSTVATPASTISPSVPPGFSSPPMPPGTSMVPGSPHMSNPSVPPGFSSPPMPPGTSMVPGSSMSPRMSNPSVLSGVSNLPMVPGVPPIAPGMSNAPMGPGLPVNQQGYQMNNLAASAAAATTGPSLQPTANSTDLLGTYGMQTVAQNSNILTRQSLHPDPTKPLYRSYASAAAQGLPQATQAQQRQLQALSPADPRHQNEPEPMDTAV